MENKEDYVGYEDQELCNRYYKEADAMRQKQDWSRLRAVELVRNNNQEMVVDRNAIREQLYSEDLY